MSTDHDAEWARRHIGYANSDREAEMAHLGYAQVHALLAIAAELRTANVVAVYCGDYGLRLASDVEGSTKQFLTDYVTAATQPEGE